MADSKRKAPAKIGFSPSGRYKVFVAHPEGGDDDDFHDQSRKQMVARVKRAIQSGRSVAVYDDLDDIEIFRRD